MPYAHAHRQRIIGSRRNFVSIGTGRQRQTPEVQFTGYTYAHIYINIQMYKCDMSTLYVHYGAQQSPDSVYIMTSVHSVLV